MDFAKGKRRLGGGKVRSRVGMRCRIVQEAAVLNLLKASMD